MSPHPPCSFFFLSRHCSHRPLHSFPHDALPIYPHRGESRAAIPAGCSPRSGPDARDRKHTSELQSRFDLVCRLLLEKKKNTTLTTISTSTSTTNTRHLPPVHHHTTDTKS